jgi:hypothetical protein
VIIEGIPEGYELVRTGSPKRGEFIVAMSGAAVQVNTDYSSAGWVIVRKKPEPLRLRVGAWYKQRDGKTVGPGRSTCRNRWARYVERHGLPSPRR